MKPRDGVQENFYDFDTWENHQALVNVWKEKLGGSWDEPKDLRWFDKDDEVASARNAIILLSMQHLVDANRWLSTARKWRDFLMCVLGREPYRTKDSEIINMVHAALQMVIRASWERREQMFKLFIEEA